MRSCQKRLFLLVTISFALWWPSLVATLGLALSRETHTHVILILPLSLLLIYADRARLGKPAASFRSGAVLLAAALLVGVPAQWFSRSWPYDASLTLSVFALVLWWIGSFTLCFGIRYTKALIFPLCLLFWLVPIPEAGLDGVIQFLQRQSAFAARILFIIAGVPVSQDGLLLSVPGLDVEVAPECSSIRSSLMLLISILAMAHLFLRSWWRKALFILMTVPLAALKNGLRIFVLVQIGTHLDPDVFDSDLHHRGGIVFFAISIVIAVGVLYVLRRTESFPTRGLGSGVSDS